MSRLVMESPVSATQPVAGRPRMIRPRRTAWLVDSLTTTPGRLTGLAVAIVVGAIVIGGLASAADRSRAHAAEAARAQTEPLLIQAVNLYTALADANATATTTFLTGGLEPPARRAQYLADLHLASRALAALTQRVGMTDHGLTASIAALLPTYSGLVEQARANNRQGFPVGAAYLRQGSALLTQKMLPTANQLYAAQAAGLASDYGAGMSTGSLLVLAIAGACGIGLLVAAQVYLAKISHRILNLPMLVASAVLAGVCLWAVIGLVQERSALMSAQRDGSDSVELLSASRVLFSRAQSDQSLILVNRGSDETDPVDLQRVLALIAPPHGLLGELEAIANRTNTQAIDTRMAQEFGAFEVQAADISALERQGRTGDAIALASTNSAQTAQRLTQDLEAETTGAQQRFARSAASATSSLSGLGLAIPLLTAVAGLLALLGVRRRLGEYR